MGRSEGHRGLIERWVCKRIEGGHRVNFCTVFSWESRSRISYGAISTQPLAHMYSYASKSESIALLTLKKYFCVRMRESLGTTPVPEPAELCSKDLAEELNNAVGWFISGWGSGFRQAEEENFEHKQHKHLKLVQTFVREAILKVLQKACESPCTWASAFWITSSVSHRYWGLPAVCFCSCFLLKDTINTTVV